MDPDIPSAFDGLEQHELWGVSPYSLLLANTARRTGSSAAEAAIRRTHDITILRTNVEVPWEEYREFLNSICDQWFPDPIGQAAVCATQDTATQFVVGAAFQQESGVMRGLRLGVDAQLDTDDENPVLVSERDLKSVTDPDDIRMLRSLNVLRRSTDGYRFDRALLDSLRTGKQYATPEAAWALTARLCDRFDIQSEAAIRFLLRWADIPRPESPPDRAAASIPMYLGNPDLSEFVATIFSDDFPYVLTTITESAATERERLQQALRFGVPPGESKQSVDWPLPDEYATICATASQQNLPVASAYLAAHLDQSQYSIHTRLREAGIDATLTNGLIRFRETYAAPSQSPSSLEQYRGWLTDQVAALEASEHALEELSRRVSTGWRRQRQSLLEGMLQTLEEFRVSPTTFVFSMLDPNYLDEHRVDQYVGNSPLLKDEVRQIERWRAEQPADADTFSSMLSEVCHYPVSSDTANPTLRIMSPWMNFAIQDYTATFRHLIENDITIKLLFRLPSARGWNNLKQHLLNRLGDTQGNLELRTYTRFKEFHDHTELQNLIESEDNYIGETGIHAKLYIAGDNQDGSLVAGSANLMENSFFFNPEAGLQTHDPNVLETAIEYFDLIWNLAEPDRIDESVFTGKTNFTFYPKVYRP